VALFVCTTNSCAPADTEELGEVFRRSVREVASRDYRQAQIEAWVLAPGEIAVWAQRMQNRTTFVAEENGRLIGFIRELVHRLVSDGVADQRRIYLAGISNGGMMSFTLVCKAGELFAGVGTVIANMPEGIGSCAPRPMPVVMINGTADPMVPYDGGGVGLGGGRGDVWSAERTAKFFAARDGCDRPTTEALANRDQVDGTAVTRIDWRSCRPGTTVTLYRVEGGGHALPGRRSLFPRILGASNQDIVSAEVILDAFAWDPDR